MLLLTSRRWHAPITVCRDNVGGVGSTGSNGFTLTLPPGLALDALPVPAGNTTPAGGDAARQQSAVAHPGLSADLVSCFITHLYRAVLAVLQ